MGKGAAVLGALNEHLLYLGGRMCRSRSLGQILYMSVVGTNGQAQGTKSAWRAIDFIPVASVPLARKKGGAANALLPLRLQTVKFTCGLSSIKGLTTVPPSKAHQQAIFILWKRSGLTISRPITYKTECSCRVNGARLRELLPAVGLPVLGSEHFNMSMLAVNC